MSLLSLPCTHAQVHRPPGLSSLLGTLTEDPGEWSPSIPSLFSPTASHTQKAEPLFFHLLRHKTWVLVSTAPPLHPHLTLEVSCQTSSDCDLPQFTSASCMEPHLLPGPSHSRPAEPAAHSQPVAHTHSHMVTRAHTHTLHVLMHNHMHSHTLTHSSTHIYTHAFTHTPHTLVHITRTYVYALTRTQCTYAPTCAHTHILTCSHTHTYTLTCT